MIIPFLSKGISWFSHTRVHIVYITNMFTHTHTQLIYIESTVYTSFIFLPNWSTTPFGIGLQCLQLREDRSSRGHQVDCSEGGPSLEVVEPWGMPNFCRLVTNGVSTWRKQQTCHGNWWFLAGIRLLSEFFLNFRCSHTIMSRWM